MSHTSRHGWPPHFSRPQDHLEAEINSTNCPVPMWYLSKSTQQLHSVLLRSRRHQYRRHQYLRRRCRLAAGTALISHPTGAATITIFVAAATAVATATTTSVPPSIHLLLTLLLCMISLVASLCCWFVSHLSTHVTTGKDLQTRPPMLVSTMYCRLC